MKKYSGVFMHAILLTITLFSILIPSPAQITINSASLVYHQNFNSLDTTTANSSNLPGGWYIIEYGSTSTVNNQYKGNSGTSATGDTYSYGSSGSSERALGALATSGNRSSFGVVFKNNTGTVINSISIGYRGEQWRRGTCSSDTLHFRYSSTALGLNDTTTGTWTPFPRLSLISPYSSSSGNTALDGNAAGNYVLVADTIPVNIPAGDSLWIAWWDKDVSGSDDGLAIDDLSVTFLTSGEPIPENIYLTGKSPSGIDIDPAVNTLSMHFDHLIEQGNGQITLYSESGAVTIFTVPSSQMTVTDSTVTLHNVLLENNSRYHILMTTGTFIKAGDTIKSQGISDTTFWTFTTADTVVVRPLTMLNESFESCPDEPLGIFKPYNMLGFKTWKCTSAGHSGNSCAGMSGGITDGISDSNEDWLISQSAFDFSAMSKPELSFWQRKRFTGIVNRTIRISNDYIPGDNPGLATWTTLQVQDMVDDPSEDWTPIADIDLSPYKNTPFYIAFTYSCGEQGAYELAYDDLLVQDEALSISNPSVGKLQLQVTGPALSNIINFSISQQGDVFSVINIFSLTGRKLYTTTLKTLTGKRFYQINNANLLPGMYMLTLHNQYGSARVKLLIL